MLLNDLKIKKIKPDTKPRKYADGDGLFLYVNITGTKSWRFRYRDISGKEKEMTIGTYPDVSIINARDKRYAARLLLREGKDPNIERQEIKKVAQLNYINTLQEVAKEWFEITYTDCSERHCKKVTNSLNTHVIQQLGSRPISSIDALEILHVIREVEKVGMTDLAHRLLCYCVNIFSYAVITKRLQFNPLADLKKVLKPNKPVHTPTITIDEVPTFLRTLDNFKAHEIHKLAIKLLLLTFVRTKELRQSKWEYIDFNKKLWIIPKELMKMRHEHIVPLSKQVLKVLERLKVLSGDNEYLFPSMFAVKHPYMNENVINKILKAKGMGYEDRLTGHGFRSLASTTLNELGWFHPQVIEKQLAHEEKNKVRAAYNRAQYLPQRIELMQRWADYIDTVIADDQNKKMAA